MTWTIEYSRDADRFIQAEGIQGEVKRQIEGFLRKLLGESINIDVKKLKGEWKGYFRIRKGRIRIIFTIDTSHRSTYVERVDFRGDAYK
jgi:mRNA-degrading endonuclease RelE of RelBE toxin-antitoxin system